MKKIILTTLATAVALSAVTPSNTPASAAVKVKVKSGKLVNASTGKVVTGAIVYNKQLYKNGVLAKGKVLHKNVLYVNGKIKGGAVQYKNKFYKKGKLIGKNVYFEYEGKLYINNKVAKGETVYNHTYYKDGEVDTGSYKNNIYKFGELVFEGNTKNPYERYVQNVTYSTNGSTATYEYIGYYTFEFKFNKSKIIVSPKATVKSVKVTEDGVLKIILSNVKKNTVYNVQVKDLKVGGYPLTFSTKISGLPDGVNKYNFTELNAAYNKHKNAKKADLKKLLKTAEGKEITKQLAKGDKYMKTFNYKKLTAAQFAYYSVHEKLSGLISSASYDYE